MTIEVSLADLALMLYLPSPSINLGPYYERGGYRDATCNACGMPAGGHYCAPREAARIRLSKLTQAALSALPDGVAP